MTSKGFLEIRRVTWKASSCMTCIILGGKRSLRLKEEINYKKNPPDTKLGGWLFLIAITVILPTWSLIASLTHDVQRKFNLSGTQTNVLKGKSVEGISGDAKEKMWLRSIMYCRSHSSSFKIVVQLPHLKSVRNVISPS